MIRGAQLEDLRFIRSAWIASYASSDWARLHTPRDVWDSRKASAEYYTGQRALIEHLLTRSTVLISEETPSMIDGFLVHEGRVLHYVYVRQSARGRGVARALADGAGLLDGAHVTYTHRSRDLIGKKVPRAWRFSKFALAMPALFTGGKAA